MSRNGSGTYTLPVGNPVVSGTTITSAWANSTLTDIATALFGKWKGQNPHVTWQFKPKALVKDSQIMDPLKDKLDFQNLPKLNRNNVRELVLARISLMLDPEDDHAATLALYAKELDEVINE